MQGFNMGRYVPPEHEGTTSANKLARKHALGVRARKLPQGILTVRFEMPFAVWCTTCPKPTIIGQGVRFNAEKKKVGNYYSTPVYSFRMKHTACGGIIEIRTDPQNTAYVVTEGGKKRDTGDDKELEGDFIIKTEEEKERLRNDAFAALEGKVEDKRKADGDSKRIEELKALRERDWADPYIGSQKLRRTFRADRKVREKNEETTEALKDKMGLSIELLDETEEDKTRAGLVEFGDSGEMAIEKVKVKPLFVNGVEKIENEARGRRGRKRSAREIAKADAAKKKASLQRVIRGNTLAAIDPFLIDVPTPRPMGGHLLVGKKRTQHLAESSPAGQAAYEIDSSHVENSGSDNHMESRRGPRDQSSALVDYDTD